MNKLLVCWIFLLSGTIAPVYKVSAQDPVTLIIKAAVKKVIKAADLQVQRQQNKVIWLQNAQKTLENTMSKLKLDEITDWVEKQRTLYKDYYEELYRVKSIIAYHQRIKDIATKQVRLVEEYKRAWQLFRQDKHFTADELEYMSNVYAGILGKCAQNIDQLFLVVKSFTTQMSDAKRIEILNTAVNKAEANYYDLIKFNQQNIMLSLQRSKEQNDADVVKKLYGLK